MLPPAAALAATKTGVRVISFERPGFGQSDPRANYTFDGVAEDAEDLCRLLNLRNVGLFGDGYGGGFAVATALRLGTAVRRLALHAPNLGRRIEPTSQPTGVSVFSRQLWIVPLAAEILRKGLRNSVVRSLMSYVAERSRKDAARMNDRKFDDYLVSAVFDALEKTSVGLAAETVMFGKGLRVEAANIKRPISVWHGAENSIVPLSNSIAEFTNHPFAKLNVFSDAGLFLGQREFEEIFSWMATAPSQGHVKIGEQIHPLA